jgi:ureidoglycolate dehydrogenase (NAD+)
LVEFYDFGGVTVSCQALTTFTEEIFRAAGMPSDYAKIETEMLLWSNLRGIDSHGVLRIPFTSSALGRALCCPKERRGASR